MNDDLLAYAAIKEEMGPVGCQRVRLFNYLWTAGRMTHDDAENPEKCGKPKITVIRSRIPEIREVLERHGYTIDTRLEPNSEKGQHAVYHLVKLKTDDQRWRERCGVGKEA